MTKRQKIIVYRDMRRQILARLAVLRDQRSVAYSATALDGIALDIRFERHRLVWQRKWVSL